LKDAWCVWFGELMYDKNDFKNSKMFILLAQQFGVNMHRFIYPL